MTESEGFTVTNKQVYDELKEFRNDFSVYVKEQGPKMAILEYQAADYEKRLNKLEKDREQDRLKLEEREHGDRQTKKLIIGGLIGSSAFVEILNWILFHK